MPPVLSEQNIFGGFDSTSFTRVSIYLLVKSLCQALCHFGGEWKSTFAWLIKGCVIVILWLIGSFLNANRLGVNPHGKGGIYQD